MRNIFAFVILLFLIPNTLIAENKKLKVLSILPLTGEISAIGQAVKNGIELAVNKTEVIDIIFEDDGGVPKNTVSALQKNLVTNKPDIVLTASSGTSKAIAPILEIAEIPLFAIATDEQISKDRKFSMNFWVTPDIEANVLVEEALKKGYKKIALFSSVHEGTMSLKRKFIEANQGKISTIYEEEIALDMKDFKSVITKFKSKTKNQDLDAIFVNVFFGQVGLFSKQLRQLGIKQPLFCIELFEDVNEVKNSGGALINQWYVQADDPRGEFLKEYIDKYKNSSSFGAANGHDAILLFTDGFSKGKTTSKDLNEYLHSVKDFEGALGTYSATKDNRFSLPATIKVVTADGFKKSN